MAVAPDIDKRKRVMQRSMQLGHCICDPKKPCPCDLFREKNVCTCAGERLEAPSGPVRLTDLVDSPGCASKIDEASLRRVLRGLPSPDDPRVLVGVPAGDDAGVYRLDGNMALVQTVDVFSPSVDDPYVFGQIAAANSVSDVYAMGGRPITALSIVGFPIRAVPDEVMHQILRGGLDKMAEAGVAVIGGHSIHDKEIKAGFAVTGLIDPDKIMTHAAAQPGDRLILTKPIGTGVMAFAAQIGRAPAGGPEAAAQCMAALNKRAAELMVEFGAHACTDVTGFGLMGHLAAMASASGVDVEIIWDDIPLLPGVLECAGQGIFSGAVERNRESSGGCVDADENVEPAMLDLCFDAQTSGGLLIAVPESRADALLVRLHEEGVPEAAMIGRVVGGGTGRVSVRCEGRRRIPSGEQAQPTPAPAAMQGPPAEVCCTEEEASQMSCCEEGPEPGSVAATQSGVAQIQAKFQDFLKSAGAPGALDAYTKRAMAIALSVLANCEPCVKIHVGKAREMGFSQEEIDEAAWMAISFGGSPTMLFYNRMKKP
jgi:selenide,water dikinase